MIKRTLTILAAGAFLLGVGAQQMQAAMINGSITISGGALLNSADLGSATAVVVFTDAEVQSVQGDLDTALVNPGTVVTMKPSVAADVDWTFTAGQIALWSVGGFTFDLTTSGIVLQNSGFLIVEGTGFVSGNGFTPTMGTFRFSTQEPDAMSVFSFSASVGTVPDGGTTGMLLGLSFLGAAVLRRKLS